MKIKAIVFDWGDTVMRDFPFEGAMKDWPFVAAIPGIEDALAELKKKYILVMGSNAGDSSSEDIGEALKKLKLFHYFHHVFSSKDLGFEKPHLQFFKSIEKELKLGSSDFIMIGNHCEKDIAGAAQAGWKSVWFNENQSQEFVCKHADATFYHMSALLEIMENISYND